VVAEFRLINHHTTIKMYYPLINQTSVHDDV